MVTPPAAVLVAAAVVANVPNQVLFDHAPSGSEPADRLRRPEEQMLALSGRVALMQGGTAELARVRHGEISFVRRMAPAIARPSS